MTREIDTLSFVLAPRFARRMTLIVVFALALAALWGAPSALGVTPAPAWSIHSFAIPTRFSTEDNAGCPSTVNNQKPLCDAYQVTATNVGSLPTQGPLTLSDVLPSGVTIAGVKVFWPALAKLRGETKRENEFPFLLNEHFCTTVPLRCSAPIPVPPDGFIEMVVYVTVNEPVTTSSLTNSASISGGGAAESSTSVPNPLGGPLPAFGATAITTYVSGLDGQPDGQAGDHPYELTTRIDFNSEFRLTPEGTFNATSVEDPRDVVVDLPLGFLGSARSTPTCTFAELSAHGGGGCPPDTVIGQIFTEPVSLASIESPIFNMVPERGVAAEFGFVDVLNGPHLLKASVAPTPGGYVLRTTSPEITQTPLTDVVATFYGDPALSQELLAKQEGKQGSGLAPAATFTNPSQCSGHPLAMTVHMDSWQHPGAYNADGTPDLSGARWVTTEVPTFPEGLSGCNLLQFAPTLGAQPETAIPGAADSSAGLNFDLKLAQSEEPGVLATPPLRDAVVKLPVGFTVDPSSADGLGACSERQIGFVGFNSATEVDEFTAAAPSCPDASKIGTVELTTPLLSNTLQGSVYVAAQYANPFSSLLAGYIVVDDPETGIIVKIPGELKADEHTGQITGAFRNNPQFPFSELKLHFKGGSRGVLATPENCGTFTTTSELTPWSAPDSGPAATPSDSVEISSGCVSGFTPGFTAGTTNTQAGAYAPFVMSLSRSDIDEEISGLSVSLPPGLLAKVAGVPLCSDALLAAAAANPSGTAEAANPSCPAGSQVGSVQAGSGPGPDPFFVSGKAYLTGPYKGGPYGLAVVVPAIAGPFDLGNVVVRAAIHIDPADGHVSATSDPFPTMLNSTGIPIRLRRVNISLDRPNLTFNPTSCAQAAITANLTSTRSATATVASRFQVGGCGELSFKPSFSASTEGHTSKANGASLTVKIAESPGEANIHKVNVQLPVELPSRLTTLQKACTEAQFNANPAGCPVASNVGVATAVTPVLNVPLTGPAYLVSHGNAAFPDLEFVLQGEGVLIILDGKTDIKKGITHSRFEAVPDAPVSMFEAHFPEGSHSVLAAHGDLCSSTKTTTTKRRVTVHIHSQIRHLLRSVKKTVPAPLLMPTTITGQNGAVVTQTTKITVTGCGKRAHKARQARVRRRRQTRR